MTEEKTDQIIRCVKECWWRVGILITLILGSALMARYGWPSFKLDQGTAAWIQAIGSIAAIYFSTRLGKKQAETALEIHMRDVEHRKSELEKERESSNQEKKEIALAEASLHYFILIRLQSRLKESINKVDLHFQAIANLTANEEQYKLLNPDLNGYLMPYVTKNEMLENIAKDIKEEKENLRLCAPQLEACVTELFQLAKDVIHTGHIELVTYIPSAISLLQDAIFKIESSSMDSDSVISHIKMGKSHIDDFLDELSWQLNARNTSK